MSDPLCHLSSDHLNLAVAPLGAEMQYLRTAAGEDLLWQGDPAFWSGRAPILFPIVGRAVDDIVESGGLRAEMKQHGLARRLVFSLEDQSLSACRHVLRATEATQAVYPFEFKLTVTHRLEAATLVVEVDVTNEGQGPMPFGFGFHPAFALPLATAPAAHFVTLQGGGSPMRRPLRADGLLETGLVPGPFENGTLKITDPLFEDGALVFPDGAEALVYGSSDGPKLRFDFENLPDLALWRPVGAPFLCVEPWHGTASHIGDGPEIQARPNALVLQGGEIQRFGYRVTYDA